MARRHRNVLELDDPQTAQLSGDLASARSLLSHLALAGPDRDHLDHYGAELLRRQTEVEALERRLAGRSETYRNEKASRIAGFADCVDALPTSSALIAYLRFDHLAVPNEGRPGPGGVAHETPYYAVLTIRSGGGNPRLTMLGSAAKIDALVAAWRKEVTRPGSGTKADSSYRVVATELTKKVWDPVAPQVKGVQMAFVVPDGSLSLLNFGTLLLPGNRFLVEGENKLHYLSAERDLLRPERSARGTATALVLGGPDFDQPPVAAPAVTGMDKASSKGSAVLANGSVYRGAVSSCESFRLLRFAPLPGTTAEANEVSALLARRHAAPLGPNEILKLTGREASEQALKSQAPGRLILHVATHGFFLSQNCSSLPENPLLLSGLALSGANERLSDLSGGRSEDGILTAEEVASLDLRSAEWVVLSGCETGAGVIQAGEGVLGLRRAFQIAGAQTLIMSLWSVADVPAQEWIRNLYTSRIAGSSSAEAVRDATLNMIAARRRANVSSHPHSWGAFIASGDWR